MHALPYWRLSGYYFFYFAFIGAFSPYFGLYLQSLKFSAWDIGLLMSQMQLMRLFGPNFWGWLADHYGHRMQIIRLGAVMGLAGFLSLFWLDRLPAMLCAMAVLAFFWSGALPLVEALTFDHLRQSAGTYSRIRLWGSVGFIVAVMSTGYLLDFLPTITVLWACAVILAGILLYAVMLPEAKGHAVARLDSSVRQVLRHSDVRVFLIACFFMSVAHGAYYVFYSIHLDAQGYSKMAVGMLWALGVLAEIGVFMVMGRVARHYSLRVILLACFGAAVVRFVLIGWCAPWAGVMIFAQLLHGLTFGAYHASAIAAINRWFQGAAQARGQALYSSLTFGAGGLLGALISGQTWDCLGAGGTFSLGSLFAFMGLILIWRAFAGVELAACGERPKITDPVQ